MQPLMIILVLLLVIWFAVAGLDRARFAGSGPAFPCAIRTRGGTDARRPGPSRWLRRRCWARWDRCTLVVRRGFLVPRTVELPVRECVGEAHTVATGARLFRRWALAVELVLSDGSRVQVTARRRDRLALVGPYVVAGLAGLPPAPVPRWKNRPAGP